MDDLPLAEQTARRFILAGITWDHPELVYARAWNAAAYQRRDAVPP